MFEEYVQRLADVADISTDMAETLLSDARTRVLENDDTADPESEETMDLAYDMVIDDLASEEETTFGDEIEHEEEFEDEEEFDMDYDYELEEGVSVPFNVLVENEMDNLDKLVEMEDEESPEQDTDVIPEEDGEDEEKKDEEAVAEEDEETSSDDDSERDDEATTESDEEKKDEETGEETGEKKNLTESLSLIKTHTNGQRSAKVYRDSEWNEYCVKFYKGSTYQKDADYFTDDKQDAHETAGVWIKSTEETLEEAMGKGAFIGAVGAGVLGGAVLGPLGAIAGALYGGGLGFGIGLIIDAIKHARRQKKILEKEQDNLERLEKVEAILAEKPGKDEELARIRQKIADATSDISDIKSKTDKTFQKAMQGIERDISKISDPREKNRAKKLLKDVYDAMDSGKGYAFVTEGKLVEGDAMDAARERAKEREQATALDMKQAEEKDRLKQRQDSEKERTYKTQSTNK